MCLPLATMAQEKQMVVYRDGRTPLRIDVASVDSIKFEDAVEEHEYVDLGLSVLWATCNIGAATPEEYGNYFAWGETVTKDSYMEENYVYAEKGAYKDLPKDIAGTEYDAATAIWKGGIGKELHMDMDCTKGGERISHSWSFGQRDIPSCCWSMAQRSYQRWLHRLLLDKLFV